MVLIRYSGLRWEPGPLGVCCVSYITSQFDVYIIIIIIIIIMVVIIIVDVVCFLFHVVNVILFFAS
jgi:hypothetical protein